MLLPQRHASALVSSTGAPKAIGNSEMINALIDARLSGLEANNATVVADIAARDALIAGLTANEIILVLDASADSAVTAGAAMYIYEADSDTTHLIAKYESLNLVLPEMPDASPADIDDAVDKRHSHSNKATLDQIGADGDTLTFKGNPITGGGGATEWDQTDW